MKEVSPLVNRTGKAQAPGSPLPHPGSMARLVADVQHLMQQDYAGLWASRPQLFHLAINEAASLAWLTEVPELVFPSLAQEKVQDLAKWHCRQESLLRQATPAAAKTLSESCARARICPADWPSAPCRQGTPDRWGRWAMPGPSARIGRSRF